MIDINQRWTKYTILCLTPDSWFWVKIGRLKSWEITAAHLTAVCSSRQVLPSRHYGRGNWTGHVHRNKKVVNNGAVNWGYIERQGNFEQLCGKCLNDWYCTANRQSGRVSNSVSKSSDLRKQACHYKHFMLLTWCLLIILIILIISLFSC